MSENFSPSPIQSEIPDDTGINKSNESGHKARFSGATYAELAAIRKGKEKDATDKEKTEAIKAQQKINEKPIYSPDNMTGEEALNELKYGKPGTIEYQKAAEILATKAAERFRDEGAGGNFLKSYTGFTQLRGFLRDNKEDWKQAANLLGVNESTVIGNSPSKLKAFNALADVAVLYNRARKLTSRYVEGRLTIKDEQEEYNNLPVELRTQLLRQHSAPLALPRWMRQTQPPQVEQRVSSDKGSTDTEEDENLTSPFLQKLEPDQHKFIIDNFTGAEIDMAEKIMAGFTEETNQFVLDNSNNHNNIILITLNRGNGDTNARYYTTLVNASNAETYLDDDENIKRAFRVAERLSQKGDIPFSVLMAMNMMFYDDNVSKQYRKKDFEFKQKLYEQHKNRQSVIKGKSV